MKEDLSTFWRTYFNFTKGEKNAFFILVFLIAAVSLYPFLDSWIGRPAVTATDFSELLALVNHTADTSDEAEDLQQVESKDRRKSGHYKRFHFDPNTIDPAEFEELGFRRYIAVRIEKFRTHGGKFRVKSDLYKVYGIDSGLVKSLWNEIQLPEVFELHEKEIPDKPWVKREPGRLEIEINSADTNELVKLPGIGNRLASRIVQFRDKLGGFYSLEQLYEVYGLKPKIVELIKPKLIMDISHIRMISINDCDENTLDAHPYIDRTKARIIVQYRRQHGPYSSMEDLKKALVSGDETINRIKNYIKF